jgi:hypothetical protein
MRAPTLLDSLAPLLAQVDPYQGTAAAQQGAVQRLADPNMYDIIFPVIAFGLVILLPVAVGLWVIVKTIKDDKPEADET